VHVAHCLEVSSQTTTYPHIQREFQPLLKNSQSTIHLAGENEVEVDKISTEIDIVIKKRVEELSIKLQLQDSEKELLQNEISANENRTYLWAHLIFGVIDDAHFLTKSELRNTVSNLPQSVNEAYNQILNKSPKRALAKEVPPIIVAAERPLSLQEMVIALTINKHHRSYTELEPKLKLESRFPKTIREICELFVVILTQRSSYCIKRPKNSWSTTIQICQPSWHHPGSIHFIRWNHTALSQRDVFGIYILTSSRLQSRVEPILFYSILQRTGRFISVNHPLKAMKIQKYWHYNSVSIHRGDQPGLVYSWKRQGSQKTSTSPPG
jgi:3-deoxy-D-manno-octulosonate 8-phosphate phosphatase KdsC-like HAD superfamily phosphatase